MEYGQGVIETPEAVKMDIWAIIPVKSLFESKRRLARLLPCEQRAQLIQDLLRNELTVLSQVPAITQVLVISSDPAVWALAQQFGALVEKEQSSQGLNAAVTHGMSVAAWNDASGALMLPVDLPFITISDVDLMVNAGLDKTNSDTEVSRAPAMPGGYGHHYKNRSGRVMAICSDEDGDGTNALFLNPVLDFSFQYGPGSFQRHIQEAKKRGLTARIVSAPGLKFDLDNEKDWLSYQALVVDY